ncbi:hypothetical protein [Nocardia xishanensis]
MADKAKLPASERARRLRIYSWICLAAVAASALVIGTLTLPMVQHSEPLCASVADPPGMVTVDEPFRFTAHIRQNSCAGSDFMAAGDRSERTFTLSTIPIGDTVEAKLETRDEMKIVLESEFAKPIAPDRNASWTWELRASQRATYELALSFVVRDSNKILVGESEPMYFRIEAAEVIGRSSHLSPMRFIHSSHPRQTY